MEMPTFDLGRDVNTAEGERRRFNSVGYLFITRRALPRFGDPGASGAGINAIIVADPRRSSEVLRVDATE